MCIIATIEKGGAMPSENTLSVMWQNNPDGAGLMWADAAGVHIRKGFMAYDEYRAALAEIPAGAAAVLHLRIGTSGGIRPEMTHPFPVADDVAALSALRHDGLPVGIAHNGVLSDVPTTKTTSDTAEYIRRVVLPLSMMRRNWTQSTDVLDIIRATSTGSRLAILRADGAIIRTGEGWEQGPDGVWYSNTSYQAPRAKTWANWSAWDWSKYGADDYDEDEYYSDYSDGPEDALELYGLDCYVEDDTGAMDEPDCYCIAPDGEVYYIDADEDGLHYIRCPGYSVHDGLTGALLRHRDVMRML